MGSSQDHLIEIHRVLRTEEWKRTLAFIEAKAMATHSALPPAAPQILFGAYAGKDLIGTVSLDFAASDATLPLERNWMFERERTPLPFRRDQIAQYGRWIAERPGASAALLYVSTVFAQARGKLFYLGEMKPWIAERLREFGCVLYPVEHACLLLENIPEAERPYYAEEPPPALYMMNLDELRCAMIAHLLHVEDIRVFFQETDADPTKGEAK